MTKPFDGPVIPEPWKPLAKHEFDRALSMFSSKTKAKMRPWPEETRTFYTMKGGLPEVIPLAVCDETGIVVGHMFNGQQILVHKENMLKPTFPSHECKKDFEARQAKRTQAKSNERVTDKTFTELASALSRIPKEKLMILLGQSKEK